MTLLKHIVNVDELSQKICPTCILPSCNEDDPRCKLRQAINELKILHGITPVQRKRKKSRKEYFAKYAKENKERRAQLARERYHKGLSAHQDAHRVDSMGTC